MACDTAQTEPEALVKMLKAYPANKMTSWLVSPAVNSPKNNSPDLIKPPPSIA